MSRAPLSAVIARHSARVLALPGVVGIGEGVDAVGPYVGVFLAGNDPALVAGVPANLEGYPVRVSVTGPLTARPDQETR